MWAMEQAHCLPQLGDPAKNVERVSQLQLAGMLGLTRPTTTKRIAKYSEPDPNWPEAKRVEHSKRMRAIAANHPHWKGGGASNAASAASTSKDARRVRKHVACILQHHAGFGQANMYSLAMPEAARPAIESAGQSHAAILAAHFGEDVFDKSAQANGYRKSYGWIWHPKLPDARPCACRMGQKKFPFQKVCPKCAGKGFIIGGSMPDYGRIFLHWLLDRGIDEEIRDAKGQVTKHRGILEGWTQQQIGESIGMNASTIRRYERSFKWLNLVRTVTGKVYRHCSQCDKNFEGQCKACGSKSGQVVKRDPHKLLYLPSRTMDREIVRAEKQRLEALLAIQRRFLEEQQLAALQQAVELAVKVLGEWQDQEHRLESFWNEMRRRLAATPWLTNVLFPLQRE